jgi:hypothetical protein
VPFLRRRQEDEPAPAAAAPTAPAAPAPETPAPAEPVPETQVEPQVESQFQLVEGADEMLDMPLGTLIFRAGLIAPQQLEDALAEGLRSGKRLGEVLLGRGWLSEEDLARLLAGQKGLPYADVERVAVDRELARTMSYEDARNEMALPLVIEFGLPVVAMCDPDEAAMERLRAWTGPDTRFVVAAPSALSRLIDEVLGEAQPTSGLLVAPTEADQAEAPAEEFVQEEAVEPQPEPDSEPALAASAEEEVVAAVSEDETSEVRPIVGEGEIDYPTLSGYEAIPELEKIGSPDEQLPVEVQMDDYGYYEDPSLLEGNAWQAGEPGPPAVEEPVEPEPEEPEAEAIEPELAEPEQRVSNTWQESPPAPSPLAEEPAPGAEEPARPLEEEAIAPAGEDDLLTPAWMQGEVNVVTADVADFIDHGDSPTSTGEAPPAEGPPPVEEIEQQVEATPPLEDAGIEVEPEGASGFEPPAVPAAEEEMEASEAVPEAEVVDELVLQPPASSAEESEPGEGGEVSEGPTAATEPAPELTHEHAAQYELVLRLSDGDRVPIGTFARIEEAQEKAAEIVKQFTDAKDGSWPFISGRFLRPETIVSIDMEEHSAGWGGSGSRGRMFSGGDS